MTAITEGTRVPHPAAPAEPRGWPSIADVVKGAARGFRRRMVYVIPAIMLLAGMTLHVSEPGFLTTLQYKVFDVYQQTQPRPYVPVPVKIVDIDEESLLRFGQWPWPRTTMAKLVATLFDNGTRVVAFDIVFAEADRTAPRQALPAWFFQSKLDLEALPEDYREFATSILATIR